MTCRKLHDVAEHRGRGRYELKTNVIVEGLMVQLTWNIRIFQNRFNF